MSSHTLWGQNRPDSVKSSTVCDFFSPKLQMLKASDYCLTCVPNLKISDLEGTTEVVGLAKSVQNVNAINLFNLFIFCVYKMTDTCQNT